MRRPASHHPYERRNKQGPLCPASIYFDRTAGGDRDHCDSGRHAAAGAGPRQGIRQEHCLQQQPAPARHGHADVCGGQSRHLPPHITSSRWPDKFYDLYGKNIKILLCPSEITNAPLTIMPSNNIADGVSRSYFINGWNDYFKNHLSDDEFNNLYMRGLYLSGLKEGQITHPSDTIVLGEKESFRGDFYMDMLVGHGDDFSGAVAQDRHAGRGPGSQTGGSNNTFADGSARFYKFGRAFNPLNLWAVSDADRAANSRSEERRVGKEC